MTQIPETSIMAAIFAHQGELMVKYDEIEQSNGFIVPHPPYDLNSPRVQHRIKELCWRATEEIGEAMEERGTIHLSQQWRDDACPSLHHFLEELSDTLHFFVEASIVAGITADEVESSNVIWRERGRGMGTTTHMVKSLSIAAAEFIFAMGSACNCLKNKAWRKREVVTDVVRFKSSWLNAWSELGHLFGLLGLTIEEIYRLYRDKNAVNQLRQQGGY